MIESPLVSISCNTYNHEKYIAAAIEGFLAQQTAFPIEILIHDDASTDGTADIIRRYQARYPELIKPICQALNQHSRGVRVGHFNLERARGKYVALCEGDDYWVDPLKLQKQVEFLEKNMDYVMCFTNFDKVNERGEILLHDAQRVKTDLTQLEILTRVAPKYLTVMFRRSALDLTFFRERFSGSGDVILFTMLARSGNAKYLDFISGCYRVHLGGIWSGKSKIEQCVTKLRNSVAMRKVFSMPEERQALAIRIGKILFEIYRIRREQRSLRISIIFLREIWGNPSSFRYFLPLWSEDNKKIRLKSIKLKQNARKKMISKIQNRIRRLAARVIDIVRRP